MASRPGLRRVMRRVVAGGKYRPRPTRKTGAGTVGLDRQQAAATQGF